jgi:hypothetical protein
MSVGYNYEDFDDLEDDAEQDDMEEFDEEDDDDLLESERELRRKG